VPKLLGCPSLYYVDWQRVGIYTLSCHAHGAYSINVT